MVDSAVVKKTQDSLGKVIKKPPLTEKLLSKPPFRYLHDIISEVTKNTGFLEGLFDDNEKTSASVKEKEAKLAYLQKAIDAVGLVIGSQLSARPSKIIAGQEPEKTNEFLQFLGRCAAKGADKEIVKKVRNGEKPGKKSEKDGSKAKSERKPKDGDRKSKSSKERDSSKGRERRDQSSSKERVSKDGSKERVSKDRSKERVSGSSKERRSKERPERGRRERPKGDHSKEDVKAAPTDSKQEAEKDEEEEKARKEREREERKEREREERRKRKEVEEEDRRRRKEEDPAAAAAQQAVDTASSEQALQQDPEGDSEEKALTNGFHEEETPARIPRPSSAKGTRRRPEPTANTESPEQQKTYAEVVERGPPPEPTVPIMAGQRRERPSSARPAPPKIKRREDESTEEVAREGSGRAPVGIIVDAAAQDEEDDMFVSEETEESRALKQPVIMGSGGTGTEGGQHGGLVQKIIDSQKQYTPESEKQEDRAPRMNQAARQKERGLVKKEIDQLRSGIQTLASSAAPLGKVLDYLQEDLDSMQKELENWRSENKYHETAINAEESHMEKMLEPLRDQLEETEHQIVDVINKINTMKCNIHNNDTKIVQMLSTMSFSAS